MEDKFAKVKKCIAWSAQQGYTDVEESANWLSIDGAVSSLRLDLINKYA
jgi:DNA uptake protein ComE-like DNA-binding protein